MIVPAVLKSLPLFGILAVVVLAGLATVLGNAAPLVGSAVFAILLGAIVRNMLAAPPWLSAGGDYATKKLLKLAIILLGAGMSFAQIGAIGLSALAIILVSIVAALALTVPVGIRLGLPAKLCSLIGAGTAICGATAIATLAPIVRSKQQETAYAIATIFVFNVLAVPLYPLLGSLLGLSDLLFGVWAGVAIHDTSSVVASAYMYSDAAGQSATVVKLTRTTMLIPLALVFAFLFRRQEEEALQGATAAAGAPATIAATREPAAAEPSLLWRQIGKSFPWFILGFLAMALLNTLGLLGGALIAHLNVVAKFLITMAMVGVGLAVDYRQILALGSRPLLLGLFASVVIAVASLALINGLLG